MIQNNCPICHKNYDAVSNIPHECNLSNTSYVNYNHNLNISMTPSVHKLVERFLDILEKKIIGEEKL